jgi:hypothetical protein
LLLIQAVGCNQPMLQSLRLLTRATTTTNSQIVAGAALATAAHFGTAAPISPHAIATSSLNLGQEPDAVDCVVVGAGAGQLGAKQQDLLAPATGNSQHAQMGCACSVHAACLSHLHNAAERQHEQAPEPHPAAGLSAHASNSCCAAHTV